VPDVSVQTSGARVTLRSMNDRHGRANLEQIRILMEELAVSHGHDSPPVLVEPADAGEVDGETALPGTSERPAPT
jgi:hypothetical protein